MYPGRCILVLTMFVYSHMTEIQCKIYRPELNNFQIRGKKLKNIANS